MTSEFDVQAAVASFGRANYEVRCTVDDGPARIVMDAKRVAVATGALLVASFAEVDAEWQKGSCEVRIRVSGTPVTVVFADDRDAEKFVRVLGVRKNDARPPEYATRVIPSSFGGGGRPGNEYEKWAGRTLLASSVLIVVGWTSVALGVFAAVVVLANDGGAVALVWLVAAATGGAMPLGLGTLARTVVLRFRQQDALR